MVTSASIGDAESVVFSISISSAGTKTGWIRKAGVEIEQFGEVANSCEIRFDERETNSGRAVRSPAGNAISSSETLSSRSSTLSSSESLVLEDFDFVNLGREPFASAMPSRAAELVTKSAFRSSSWRSLLDSAADETDEMRVSLETPEIFVGVRSGKGGPGAFGVFDEDEFGDKGDGTPFNK